MTEKTEKTEIDKRRDPLERALWHAKQALDAARVAHAEGQLSAGVHTRINISLNHAIKALYYRS